MAINSAAIDKARAAGYSDDEIIDHIASLRGYKGVPEARSAGYSSMEILGHLRTLEAPATVPGAEQTGTPGVRPPRLPQGLGGGPAGYLPPEPETPALNVPGQGPGPLPGVPEPDLPIGLGGSKAPFSAAYDPYKRVARPLPNQVFGKPLQTDVQEIDKLRAKVAPGFLPDDATLSQGFVGPPKPEPLPEDAGYGAQIQQQLGVGARQVGYSAASGVEALARRAATALPPGMARKAAEAVEWQAGQAGAGRPEEQQWAGIQELASDDQLTLDKVGKYAARSTAQAVPSIGATVVASMLPGGKFAGPALSYLMSVGEIYDSNVNKGVHPDEASKIAGLAGGPSAALDYFEPFRIKAALSGKSMKELLKDTYKHMSVLQRAGKATAEGLVESGTEMGQELIAILSEWYGTGKAPSLSDAAWRVGEAGAGAFGAGGIGGGVQQVGAAKDANRYGQYQKFVGEYGPGSGKAYSLQGLTARRDQLSQEKFGMSYTELRMVNPSDAKEIFTATAAEAAYGTPAPTSPEGQAAAGPAPGVLVPPGAPTPGAGKMAPAPKPVFDDPEALYQDAVQHASGFRQLGVTNLSQKYGISKDDAHALLERLVQDGLFVAKPLKDGGTSYVNLALQREAREIDPATGKPLRSPVTKKGAAEEAASQYIPPGEGDIPPGTGPAEAAPPPGLGDLRGEEALKTYEDLTKQLMALVDVPGYKPNGPFESKIQALEDQIAILKPAADAHLSLSAERGRERRETEKRVEPPAAPAPAAPAPQVTPQASPQVDEREPVPLTEPDQPPEAGVVKEETQPVPDAAQAKRQAFIRNRYNNKPEKWYASLEGEGPRPEWNDVVERFAGGDYGASLQAAATQAIQEFRQTKPKEEQQRQELPPSASEQAPPPAPAAPAQEPAPASPEQAAAPAPADKVLDRLQKTYTDLQQKLVSLHGRPGYADDGPQGAKLRMSAAAISERLQSVKADVEKRKLVVSRMAEAQARQATPEGKAEAAAQEKATAEQMEAPGKKIEPPPQGPEGPSPQIDKPVWGMTLEEVNQTGYIARDVNAGNMPIVRPAMIDAGTAATNASEHARIVAQAVAQGKPVPAHVLAEYPDLQTAPKSKGQDPKPGEHYTTDSGTWRVEEVNRTAGPKGTEVLHVTAISEAGFRSTFVGRETKPFLGEPVPAPAPYMGPPKGRAKKTVLSKAGTTQVEKPSTKVDTQEKPPSSPESRITAVEAPADAIARLESAIAAGTIQPRPRGERVWVDADDGTALEFSKNDDGSLRLISWQRAGGEHFSLGFRHGVAPGNIAKTIDRAIANPNPKPDDIGLGGGPVFNKPPKKGKQAAPAQEPAPSLLGEPKPKNLATREEHIAKFQDGYSEERYQQHIKQTGTWGHLDPPPLAEFKEAYADYLATTKSIKPLPPSEFMKTMADKAFEKLKLEEAKQGQSEAEKRRAEKEAKRAAAKAAAEQFPKRPKKEKVSAKESEAEEDLAVTSGDEPPSGVQFQRRADRGRAGKDGGEGRERGVQGGAAEAVEPGREKVEEPPKTKDAARQLVMDLLNDVARGKLKIRDIEEHLVRKFGAQAREQAQEIARAVEKWKKDPQRVVPEEVSTRLTTGVSATEDPFDSLLLTGDGFRKYPQVVKLAAAVIVTYPHMKPGTQAGDPQQDKQIVKDFIKFVEGNLLWLHDRYEREWGDILQRSKLWYDGGRKIAEEYAKEFGVEVHQVAAVIAVLSPKMDWFQNVDQAKRVLKFYSIRESAAWDDKMEAGYQRMITSNAATEASKASKAATEGDEDYEPSTSLEDDYKEIQGKRWTEISDKRLQAVYLRMWDEGNNPRSYDVLSPEGNVRGKSMTKKGTEATSSWTGFGPIAKALSVLNDPSHKNVSDQLGKQHKVRSFFNNILGPNSPNHHVTVDTHAVAAGTLRPLGLTDDAVKDNLSPPSTVTGEALTYGLNAIAARNAGRQRGLLGREMQSITWEAVRGLFPSSWKNEVNKAKVDAIWQEYANGTIKLETAREKIYDLRQHKGTGKSIIPPEWSDEYERFTKAEDEYKRAEKQKVKDAKRAEKRKIVEARQAERKAAALVERERRRNARNDEKARLSADQGKVPGSGVQQRDTQPGGDAGPGPGSGSAGAVSAQGLQGEGKKGKRGAVGTLRSWYGGVRSGSRTPVRDSLLASKYKFKTKPGQTGTVYANDAGIEFIGHLTGDPNILGANVPRPAVIAILKILDDMIVRVQDVKTLTNLFAISDALEAWRDNNPDPNASMSFGIFDRQRRWQGRQTVREEAIHGFQRMRQLTVEAMQRLLETPVFEKARRDVIRQGYEVELDFKDTDADIRKKDAEAFHEITAKILSGDTLNMTLAEREDIALAYREALIEAHGDDATLVFRYLKAGTVKDVFQGKIQPALEVVAEPGKPTSLEDLKFADINVPGVLHTPGVLAAKRPRAQASQQQQQQASQQQTSQQQPPPGTALAPTRPSTQGGPGAAPPAASTAARFDNLASTMDATGNERDKTFREKLREEWSKFSFTRQFLHIPPGATFAEFKQKINYVSKAQGTSIHKAAQAILDQLKGLDKDEYKQFLRVVTLDDLTARVMQQIREGKPVLEKDLPWGLKDPYELVAMKTEARRRAAGNPKIAEALRQRREMWAKVKPEYIAAMKRAGVDVSKLVSRKDYFRHRVLKHLEAKELPGGPGSGAGQRFKLPTARSWMKKAEVNKQPYSLDYIRAEFEVLSEMMYDTERANFIGWLANDSGHNIAKPLIRRAAAHNKAVIMPTFARMARYYNNKNPRAPRLTAEMMYQKVMKMRPRDPGWKQRVTKRMAGAEYIGSLEKAYNTFKLDTHSLYQANEKEHFFLASTIPESLANAIHTNGMGVVAADKIKKILAKGRRQGQMVLPREIVATMKEFMQPPTGTFNQFMEKWGSKPLSWWKQSKLIHPVSVVKYNLRNLSGDLERVLTTNPKALKHVKRAMGEIYQFMRTGKPPSKEFEAWWNRGGMDANLQVAEIGEVNRLKDLAHLKLQDPRDQGIGTRSALRTAKIWNGIWGGTRAMTDYREGILRFATFLEYKNQIEASPTGRPKNFGASIREEVMALRDTDDRAYKLSNDLMLAYDEVSVAGQKLRRDWVPFWSFQEKNAQAYKRMIVNAYKDGGTAAGVGYALLGATATTARVGLWTAAKVARTAMLALALKTLTELWNNYVMDDEEEDLPENVKKSTHLILGRDSNGKVIAFTRLGTVDDLLEWGGLEAAPYYVREYLNGRMSFEDLVKETAFRPFGVPLPFKPGLNKIAQSIHPGFKTTAELASGRAWFPNVFEQREIRDRGEYIARELGITALYKALWKKPQPKVWNPKRLLELAVYTYDPNETHYNAFKYDKVAKWGAEHGADLGGGLSQKKAAQALYDVRMAVRYDDQRAFLAALIDYRDAGGTQANLKKSFERLHPLGSLKKSLRDDFRKSLSPKEAAQLKKAEKFWEDNFQSHWAEVERSAKEQKLPVKRKK